MTIEQTLSIIKPDAVAKNVIGEIIHRFEKAEFKNSKSYDGASFKRGS